MNTATYRNKYRAVSGSYDQLVERLDELCNAGLVAGSDDGVLNQEFNLLPINEAADIWTLIWKPAAPKVKKTATRRTINARLADLLPPSVEATAEKDEQWQIITSIGTILATAPTLAGLNRKVLAANRTAWSWFDARLNWDRMNFEEKMDKKPPALYL